MKGVNVPKAEKRTESTSNKVKIVAACQVQMEQHDWSNLTVHAVPCLKVTLHP